MKKEGVADGGGGGLGGGCSSSVLEVGLMDRMVGLALRERSSSNVGPRRK